MALNLTSALRARRNLQKRAARRGSGTPHEIDETAAWFLDLIRRLANAVSNQQNLDESLWHVAQVIVDDLGFEHCSIYLLDADRSTLIQRATQGPENPTGRQVLIPIRVPLGSGVVGTVARSGEPQLVTGNGMRSARGRRLGRSRLAVPLMVERRVIGVIDCQARAVDAFDKRHITVLATVASVVADKLSHRLTRDQLTVMRSELEETRTSLRVGEERYRVLYDEHPSMFVMLDSLGVVKLANRFALDQLGYTEAELVARPVADLYCDETPMTILSRITQCLESPHRLHRFESDLVRKDGSKMRVRETARVVDFDGDVNTLLLVIEDITDTYNLSKELEFQATHDSLTGLVNRREFERRLSRALATSRSDGVDHALCFLDLDQFKLINDTCGHGAGDELLRELGALFSTRIRQSDTVARLGGDEFGVLMESCSLAHAERIADALRKAVEDFRFTWNDQHFSTGVSVGLVAITPASDSVGEVMAYADAACYAAKESGRNRLHVYRLEDEDIMRRDQEMRWVSRIEKALDTDRFRLFAQPIAPLRSTLQTQFACEVLLRMVGDDDELILPDGFLPAAERYGLAVRIDRWVLQKTVEWLRENGSIKGPDIVSVNLSGRSLCDEGFLKFAYGLLRGAEADVSALCIEITETTAIANFARATRFIDELRKLGVRFALDDFGSGFSSFTHLRRLPVQFLKIDGELIRDIMKDPVEFAMIRSISDIGHMLGKQTIAEYVETDEVLEAMRDAGLDFVQGLVVGEAVPIDQVLPGKGRLTVVPS